MEIHVIDTGYFYADGGAMFGAIPKTAWRRVYPCNENNQCILAIRSLLIKTDCGKIVLVDTGIGNKHLEQLKYYQFFDLVDIKDALLSKGVTPDEVTDVILTHLHFDHCGGTTQYSTNKQLEITFPYARHWVSNTQWENSLSPHPIEKESIFPENTQPLHNTSLLNLIHNDTKISPQIELRLADGHSPGQIMVYIHKDEQIVVFPGDVIPVSSQVSPSWISAYDLHPVLSFDQKMKVLNEATDKEQILIFCHDNYIKAGSVKKVLSFFKVDHKSDLFI